MVFGRKRWLMGMSDDRNVCEKPQAWGPPPDQPETWLVKSQVEQSR